MFRPLYMPTQYSASKDVEELRKEVELNKSKLMKKLSTSFGRTMPVHVEGMLTPYLVADVTGLKKLDEGQVFSKARTLLKSNYVSI